MGIAAPSSEKPLALDDPASLDRFFKVLSLRQRRLLMSGERIDRRQLSDEERRVYDIIIKHLKRHLSAQPDMDRERGEAQLRQAVQAIGERETVRPFLEMTQIMGVSYNAFVLNALICLVLFIVTQNFISVFFVAPVIHVLAYVYYLPRIARQRKEATEKILAMG